MKKLNICLVAPIPPPYGGIANWTDMMLKNTPKDQVDYVVINSAPSKRTMEGRGLVDRIVVSGFKMLKLNRELKAIIHSKRLDAIHITTSGSLATVRDILLLKTARRFNIPAYYHIRFGRIDAISKGKTREWKMIAKAMKLAEKVITIDETTYQAVRRELPQVKVINIPNPVNVEKLPKPIHVSSKTVTYLGWVVHTKGIEELISAWEKIAKKYADWKLQLIGPYKEEYMNQLKKQYTFQGVSVLGEKAHDEAMNIVNSSEILILPSYTEGFPNVIVEAMAMEKAVIATRVGAIPEMLNEDCGVLINPCSSSDIVEALESLITDEMLRVKLGHNACKKAQNEYAFHNILERYKNEWKA